eukprot:Opistho-2@21706
MRLVAASLLVAACLSAALAAPPTTLPRPTIQQLEWSGMGIGCLIHFNMQTYDPTLSLGNVPDISVFNPEKLDTDQWVQACRSFGGKYAVMVVKHNDGFALWPTKAYDAVGKQYSVQYSKFRDGKEDIFGNFINSCAKFGVRPGVYCSASENYLMGVTAGRVVNGTKEQQDAYNQIVLTMFTELWSNYGPLTEIWFDGGVLPVSEGGPDVQPLIEKLQPQAVIFNPPTPVNGIRWVGNELGVASDPNWATVDDSQQCAWGATNGDPNGGIWCPTECDTTLMSQDQWFWNPNGNAPLRPIDELRTVFLSTVGHGCNLLMDISPDTDGLVPEDHTTLYTQLGQYIDKFGRSATIASTSGAGKEVVLRIHPTATVGAVLIREDISLGQRIRSYVIEGETQPNQWTQIANGTAIGSSRIHMIDAPVALAAVRLRVDDSVDIPFISELAVLPKPE